MKESIQQLKDEHEDDNNSQNNSKENTELHLNGAKIKNMMMLLQNKLAKAMVNLNYEEFNDWIEKRKQNISNKIKNNYDLNSIKNKSTRLLFEMKNKIRRNHFR